MSKTSEIQAMDDLEPLILSASNLHGKPFDIRSLRPLDRENSATEVADSAQAYYLKTCDPSEDYVLIVSNPCFPHSVRDAVDKAGLVVAALTPEVGQHVLTPRVAGEHGGQSYAVFPRFETISDNRFLRLLQKHRMSGKLCAWLGEIGTQTRQYCETDAEKEAVYLTPLASLIDDADMPREIRAFARTCHTAVCDGSVDLFTVVEHGDLWIGNILYSRSGFPGLYKDFFVIDWGGARMVGHAGMDIVRYCVSAFKADSYISARHVQTYMSLLGISSFQLALYCMGSLGVLGQNLDQFPKVRYLELCGSVFGFLKNQGFIE